MVDLPDGEKGVRIGLLISKKYTNVTDEQTEKRTDGLTNRQKNGRTSHDSIHRAVKIMHNKLVAKFKV